MVAEKGRREKNFKIKKNSEERKIKDIKELAQNREKKIRIDKANHNDD